MAQQKTERMIVIDGVDGAGKGVQSRRLQQSFAAAGETVLLTREPGGSPAAEEIRELLVSGDPDKWDDLTELLLMYASRRAHLRDTVWPALAAGHWVISDRYADSSRAFQGIAGNLGLATVERVHALVAGDFEPALVLILDLPETAALERARLRGGGEDRFEKKGVDYHARVREAFRQIAASDPGRYRLIDAGRSIEQVGADILAEVNQRFDLSLDPRDGALMEALEPRAFPWHRPLVQRALEARDRDRLPHAVLVDSFSEQDLGEFLLYLSMVLLCDQPGDGEFCARCDVCRMLQAGTYADFTAVTLEYDEKRKKLKKNISIEQIRKLIYEVTLSHRYPRLKIAIVYPAETMNRASANALLKTLEEPPPGVLLLLATHNPGRLPVTIRSRCQHWAVHAPTRGQALAWLGERGLAEQEADRYLDFARGDPMLALRLKDSDYAALVERFRNGFGRFLRGDLTVSGLCQEIARSDPPSVRRLVEMTLSAYCLQSSGVDAAAGPVGGADPRRARELFDLRLRAQRQLQAEDTNLDLQIQLEDVLISLKRIVTRR